jgi:hypothetical protein
MTATCKAWNVVSGGPSREYLRQSDLLPDSPVVTVNRAIDIMDRGITVDFAAFADPPNAIYKVMSLDRYLVPPIQVWCPRPAVYVDKGMMQVHDMVTLWEPFLSASVGIRTTPFGTVNAEGGIRRYLFCLLAALERVMMFRPERVRILCADMMGSWAPGMSEEECEMHQSQLEQAKRELSRAQKKVNDSRGRDLAAVRMRDNAQESVEDLKKLGDPGIFKRWEHERTQLKELEKRAKEVGTVFEWVQPKQVVLA